MNKHFDFDRLKTILGGAPRPQHQTDAGVAEFECSNAASALAVCLDSLKPQVQRVEVRIGRDLAAKTNPETFKHDTHNAARRFFRDGKTSYELSCNWTDPLDRQDKIYVRVLRRIAAGQTGKPNVLSGRDIAKIKSEIAAELNFAVKELARVSKDRLVLSGLTVVCRDADTHSWLSNAASDQPAFSRSLKTLAELHATVAQGFTASYRYEEALPATAAVGQGLIAVELKQQREGIEPTFAPTSAKDHRTQPPNQVKTFEICDEPVQDDGAQLLLSFVGLGREGITGGDALCLELPAVIDRRVLAGTQLSNSSSILLVSESNPLKVRQQGGNLYLAANARRNKDGTDRPGYFVVDGNREIPLVGERVVPADGTEVVIGSESHRSGRLPDGSELRPPRIRLALSSLRVS